MCPGNYLYNLHGEIAAEVTKRLSGGSGSTAPAPGASGGAQTAVNYTVKVTATDLNIRSGLLRHGGQQGKRGPAVGVGLDCHLIEIV